MPARSFALASTEVSEGRLKLFSTNFRMDGFEYIVWSMKLGFEYGEIMIAGTRNPYPSLVLALNEGGTT